MILNFLKLTKFLRLYELVPIVVSLALKVSEDRKLDLDDIDDIALTVFKLLPERVTSGLDEEKLVMAVDDIVSATKSVVSLYKKN